MPKEFWTGEKLEKLGRMTQKKTTLEIAKHFGKSKSSIKSICKQYGLKPQPKRKGGRNESKGVQKQLI